VLGYGTFRFESAGQQQALSEITFLPAADDLYRRVSALLFSSDWGGAAASGGDDEGNPEPSPSPRPSAEEDRHSDTQPIQGLPPRQP
jgi:hypothetical protein